MIVDKEVMQDFLIEAGELFEQLNDQFVELEQNPHDSELINAIFRAYHTIKGGAGFMKLEPMVEVCHRAEDAVNQVRQGEREVTAELIDVLFQTLDEVDAMFACVRSGGELPDADAGLLRLLDQLLGKDPVAEVSPASSRVEAEPAAAGEAQVDVADMDAEFEAMLVAAQDNIQKPQSASNPDLISDDEFEAALDQIHGKGKGPGSANPEPEKPVDSSLISDDEFDAVLDQLHGKGKGPGSAKPETEKPTDSNLISDDEFDAVLDQLHGKGKGPGGVNTSIVETSIIGTETGDDADVIKVAKPETVVSTPAALKTEFSVRVDTERLDNIMTLVGELVLVRNRLSTLKQLIRHDQVVDAIATLDLVTSDLQSSVMKTRMQPIKKVFNRFPRVIRDLARKLKKDINLEMIGEETDLDKSLVDSLADPLIHLVRNAADHGIELPEERYASGKPRQGTITLSAQQEGDQVLLIVSDDGKGMDADVLRAKAVESGLMNEDTAKHLTDNEACNMIFAPGFSTKTEISDVSGRGVGMDVVKTRINELNGSIEIDSTPGQGSVITIHLPLTLAILPALMVMLDTFQFALPLSNVYEAFNMESDKINLVDGQEVMRVRDRTLPLFYLRPWLVRNQDYAGPPDCKVVVVQMGTKRFCLVVDTIIGQEEVVIKPLGAMLTTTAGFSGATITGDGSIALVLDMPSLMGKYVTNIAVF